jgi:hypothetical protein
MIWITIRSLLQIKLVFFLLSFPFFGLRVREGGKENGANFGPVFPFCQIWWPLKIEN